MKNKIKLHVFAVALMTASLLSFAQCSPESVDPATPVVQSSDEGGSGSSDGGENVTAPQSPGQDEGGSGSSTGGED